MSWFEEFAPLKGEILSLPEEFNTRPAKNSDMENIALLRHEREGGDYAELLKQSEELLGEMEKVETTKVFIAEIPGAVIGFSIMRYFIPGDDAPSNTAPEGWYLLGINVKKKYRRRGVGSELIKARLMAIPPEYDTVYFFTNTKNFTSQAFHHKFGFVKIDEDIVFPKRKFTTIYYKADLIKLRENNFGLTKTS